jgi:acyl dehydratase
LRGESRIVAVEDRGIGRGALVVVQKALTDAASGAAIATVQSTLLLRGDGGSGGFGERISTATPLPPGAPERTLELATPANAALIYRLSGDYNPLHADPNAARRAGFSRPILHGLCTYGIACRAILSAYCGNEPSRLRAMSGRFSAPVYPGDSLRFEFHETNDGLRFRARVSARNSVVIDRGRATISA